MMSVIADFDSYHLIALPFSGSLMKISSDEAFLILHKWQVDLTPVVFVGSLMPSNPVRGLVAVVTREGVWSGCDEPAAIWGFLLTGKETSFLASKFEDFEYLAPAELPSDIPLIGVTFSTPTPVNNTETC